MTDRISAISSRFERFGVECARLRSPFYNSLSHIVASDRQLLELAGRAAREPIPNVFFGAIHYLLLGGVDHELREYYPSLTEHPVGNDRLHSVFRDFCEAERASIAKLISTRRVQTNEINRSAILAPAFSVVYRDGRKRPLALVEIGSSAGLNLRWHNYRIQYSDGTLFGDPRSSIEIECESRGDSLNLQAVFQPQVTSAVGVDLNPVDLQDPDQRLWLRALVWPDHPHRSRRLQAAIDAALADPPQVRCGDALQVLPNLIAETALSATLCVFHSAVLYQFTSDQRRQLDTLLAEASKTRPLWQIAAENEDGLRVINYDQQRRVEKTLGAFDSHGAWLAWKSAT